MTMTMTTHYARSTYGSIRRSGAILTVDPALAEQLAGLHTALRPALLTRLPGTTAGTLRDHDALLVLAEGYTVYISGDDDPCLPWRAHTLRATGAMQWADPLTAGRLRRLLCAHFGTTPPRIHPRRG